MRNKPIEVSPWEVEAARRREVVEADFGAPHTSQREGTDGVRTTALVGPIVSWIASLTRTLRLGSTEQAECLSHGQAGLGASKPGA